MTFTRQNNCAEMWIWGATSRSRSELVHSIAIYKQGKDCGRLTCTCEDALFRKKEGFLLDPICPGACDHVKAFVRFLGPVLAPALGLIGSTRSHAARSVRESPSPKGAAPVLKEGRQ